MDCWLVGARLVLCMCVCVMNSEIGNVGYTAVGRVRDGWCESTTLTIDTVHLVEYDGLMCIGVRVYGVVIIIIKSMAQLATVVDIHVHSVYIFKVS